MLARAKQVVGQVVPGIIQYPFQRIKKSYDNLYVYGHKTTATAIRLVCELGGGALAVSSMWLSSSTNDSIIALATSTVGNPLLSQIAAYSVLFIGGFRASSLISKWVLQGINYKRFGVTNSEYNGLTKNELETLEKHWDVDNQLANEFFSFLKNKVLESKQKAQENTLITAPHTRNAANTKHVLQIFRKAGESKDGNLIPIFEYLAQDIARTEKLIAEIEKQKQFFTSNLELKEVKLDTETKSTHSKEDLKNMRKLEFWQNKAKSVESKEGSLIQKSVLHIMEKELEEYSKAKELSASFVARLGAC